MRAASLLSKVFLQHLKDLLTSPTFTACWLTILDFMDKYMRVGNRDLLVRYDNFQNDEKYCLKKIPKKENEIFTKKF